MNNFRYCKLWTVVCCVFFLFHFVFCYHLNLFSGITAVEQAVSFMLWTIFQLRWQCLSPHWVYSVPHERERVYQWKKHPTMFNHQLKLSISLSLSLLYCWAFSIFDCVREHLHARWFFTFISSHGVNTHTDRCRARVICISFVLPVRLACTK